MSKLNKTIGERIVNACIALTFTFVFGFGFCLFAWTAANIPPPITDANFPLPGWWWTASMAIVALTCFVSAAFCIFAALDELHSDSNDPRRLVRKAKR